LKLFKNTIFIALLCAVLTSCGNQSTRVGIMNDSNIVAVDQKADDVPVLKSNFNDRFELKKKVVIDVPYYSQVDYPTGCELISTQMLLEFYGYEVGADLMVKSGMIKTCEFEEKDGKIYGGDPNQVFIGNPDKEDGLGCYSGAIAKALTDFLPSEKYEVENLEKVSLEDICRRYIYDEIPVLIWASQGMQSTYKGENNSWIIKGTDEKFTWQSNEHCLVLVGYDEKYYYFNDPLTEKAVKYEKSVTEKRYKEMGMQAVAVTRRNS